MSSQTYDTHVLRRIWQISITERTSSIKSALLQNRKTFKPPSMPSWPDYETFLLTLTRILTHKRNAWTCYMPSSKIMIIVLLLFLSYFSEMRMLLCVLMRRIRKLFNKFRTSNTHWINWMESLATSNNRMSNIRLPRASYSRPTSMSTSKERTRACDCKSSKLPIIKPLKMSSLYVTNSID